MAGDSWTTALNSACCVSPRAGGNPLTGVCVVLSRRGMVGDQGWFGFRPGFGQQPDTVPEPSSEQQPPQPVDAVADDADGPYRPAPGVAAPGSRRPPYPVRVRLWAACAGCLGQSCGHGRLPPWCRRPGPAASPPTAPASGGRHALGRCAGFGPTSSPGF